MADTSVLRSLREATRAQHSRIENTPLAKSLLSKEIQLEQYVGYIRVLAVIHAALERSLDTCTHPIVTQVWSDDLRRLPELLEDNDCFRWQLIPSAPEADQAARQAASHILLLSKQDPVALLGCLYVLAGSTKGAVILAPLVHQALGLSSGQGLSYLPRHSHPGPEQWEQAASGMQAAVTDTRDVEAMVQAAQFLFEKLEEAFDALAPLRSASLCYLVTGLNPEAGSYDVPQDAEDLLAVLRASERSLTEFPYFLYRFGHRGRRFADADGAWLATLPGLGAEEMQRQVDWLGREVEGVVS